MLCLQVPNNLPDGQVTQAKQQRMGKGETKVQVLVFFWGPLKHLFFICIRIDSFRECIRMDDCSVLLLSFGLLFGYYFDNFRSQNTLTSGLRRLSRIVRRQSNDAS